MTQFVQGQRWVVDSEPELGLGLVTGINGRTVNIFFEQGDCERCYSIEQAPLTRIQFEIDDKIQTQDGLELTVSVVHEQAGLLLYDTIEGKIVPETALSNEIKLNQPFMRLMTGQLDHPKWFFFRRQLDGAVSRVWQSGLNGLLGTRTSLVPHQLYVAWSACQHDEVRVLLADEVGLGKTIEAGTILSRLIKQERVQRALILVPDALQVQWLVELIRKFNITPELYAGEEHDFESGQIHIVPHSAIEAVSSRLDTTEFDIAIVDEAHNIQVGSKAFPILTGLANRTRHLVLLTATPEQLGVESHFERLRLLDPAKYNGFDQFLAQEKGYLELNNQIQALPKTRDQLIGKYQLDAKLDNDGLVRQLLDFHGVGRNMFRNVRKGIEGFPSRIAHPHIIDQDDWTCKFEWLSHWLQVHTDEK